MKPLVYRDRPGKWIVSFQSQWHKDVFFVREFRSWRGAVKHLEKNRYVCTKGYREVHA